jgi:hypothetical protein
MNHHVCFEPLLIPTGGRRHEEAIAVLVNRSDCRVQSDVDARISTHADQSANQIGIEARQRPGAAMENANFRARLRCDMSKFE